MANVGRTQLRSLAKRARATWDSTSARMAGAEVDRRGVLAESAGHGDEDAVDLGLFFVEEADELVVLLDGFEGFHEDGLAGRRRAVNDAGNLALELGFDGNDEAVAANGDEVVLGAAAFGEAAEGFRRRLSSMARCWRSMARRMRRSSGEASSLRLPSGSILPRSRRRSGARSWSSSGAERLAMPGQS